MAAREAQVLVVWLLVVGVAIGASAGEDPHDSWVWFELAAVHARLHAVHAAVEHMHELTLAYCDCRWQEVCPTA
jgi:hypothetical protein